MRLALKIAPIALAIGFTATTQAAQWNQHQNTNMPQMLIQSTIAQQVGLSNQSEMKEIRRVKLANGTEKVRYQQFYQGVPVFDSNLVSSSNAQGIMQMSTGQTLSQIENDISSVTPQVSAKQALAILRRDRIQTLPIENVKNQLYTFQLIDSIPHIVSCGFRP